MSCGQDYETFGIFGEASCRDDQVSHFLAFPSVDNTIERRIRFQFKRQLDIKRKLKLLKLGSKLQIHPPNSIIKPPTLIPIARSLDKHNQIGHRLLQLPGNVPMGKGLTDALVIFPCYLEGEIF